MNAVCLQVFVSEASRHEGTLTYEWLLDAARRLHIAGGSAFRSVAGFGRHHRHDEGFFELAGDLPVVVEFFVSTEQADTLLQLVAGAGLKLVYAKLPAEIGVTA